MSIAPIAAQSRKIVLKPFRRWICLPDPPPDTTQLKLRCYWNRIHSAGVFQGRRNVPYAPEQ